MYYCDRAEKFGGFTASSLSSIVQDLPGKMKTRGKTPIRLIRYSHTIRCIGKGGKKGVFGNRRTQSICKCVHLLSRVWAIDGRLSRPRRGCIFDSIAQWTNRGISISTRYQPLINNSGKMRVCSRHHCIFVFAEIESCSRIITRTMQIGYNYISRVCFSIFPNERYSIETITLEREFCAIVSFYSIIVRDWGSSFTDTWKDRTLVKECLSKSRSKCRRL